MRRPYTVVLAAVLTFVLAACTPTPAPAPTEQPIDDGLSAVADPLPLDEIATFSGVAAMNAGSNCTGTLIDTGVDEGPAYILTNGHCVGDVGRPHQGTTIAEDWWGSAEFFRAKGNLDATLLVEVTALEYSTMRHTDTAVVRLEGTLGDLRAAGVTPVPIIEQEPAADTAVTNIGVPVQGLSDDQWVMRRGECTVSAQHTLIEFGWLWFDVWANDCPGIVQGSSGSPLFTLDAAGMPTAIAAVINTTSVGATDGGACWLNHPCEVTESGAHVVADTSYAQSAAGIGRCFGAATGVFALGGDCPLPVSNVWASQGGGSFRGGDLPDSVGRIPEVTLAGRAAGKARIALAPLGDGTVCLQEGTYAGAKTAPVDEPTDEWTAPGAGIPVDLPLTEGRFALCAVIDDDYAGAATVLFAVDRTPPVHPAGASVEDFGDGHTVVRPHLDPPELSNVRYTWGAPGQIDCEDTSTFNDFRIIPLMLDADDLPAVYCIYAMDEAGNTTPVTKIDIPAP